MKLTDKTLSMQLKQDVNTFLDDVSTCLQVERWKLYQLFPTITYYIETVAHIDRAKCIAIVRVCNEDRQCSRKHKYGLYCGLHNNFLQKNKQIKNVVDLNRVKQTCLTTPYCRPNDILRQYFPL